MNSINSALAAVTFIADSCITVYILWLNGKCTVRSHSLIYYINWYFLNGYNVGFIVYRLHNEYAYRLLYNCVIDNDML